MCLAPLPPPSARRPTPLPLDLDTLLPRGSDALSAVETLLREVVATLPAADPSAVPRGRPAVLPATVLWCGILFGVLHRLGGVRPIWRQFTYGLWGHDPVPVSDQAVYHRLVRDGATPLQSVFETLTAALAARPDAPQVTDPAWFAADVYALDTTTLAGLARRLPWQRELPVGDRRLLPGNVAGRYDVRRQCWARTERVLNPLENDRVSARALLVGLRRGSLVLTDLGYFSFAFFDDLTAAGLYYVSRLRARTSYRVIHAFYADGDTFDGLVWLGSHRADRARHAVRLVQFRQGNVLRQYITNVRDPELLPLGDVARLYARRWDFEDAAQLVKEHLGLRLWWSSQDVIVEQQLWAVLTIAQCWQAIRLEVAAEIGVDPFDVSLPLLVREGPTIALLDTDLVTFLCEHGERLGFIRPSRRIVIRAPVIPTDALVPRPVGLVLTHTPRYAKRRCA